MGTYGFVRFSIPLLPEASREAVWWVATLAIIGIIYGALVALVQKDWKSLVAYSSVSHLGFVMLGVFALNTLGLEGGILQMINHGLSTGDSSCSSASCTSSATLAKSPPTEGSPRWCRSTRRSS